MGWLGPGSGPPGPADPPLRQESLPRGAALSLPSLPLPSLPFPFPSGAVPRQRKGAVASRPGAGRPSRCLSAPRALSARRRHFPVPLRSPARGTGAPRSCEVRVSVRGLRGYLLLGMVLQHTRPVFSPRRPRAGFPRELRAVAAGGCTEPLSGVGLASRR